MSDSDEPYPLPPNLKLVPPAAPEPMTERGARIPDPPKPESSPTDRLKDIETGELRSLVTKVITVRGGRKENLVAHWIAVEALQIADPHRQAPPLVRMAALVLLRDLAMEEMRAYRPPLDALKVLEEAAEAEEIDIRRKAAEEAEAHRLRCVPLNCGLCGRKSADERHSLILGEAPKTRICEICIVTTVVTELDRRRRQAAFEEAQAREAEADGISRRETRRWKRELTQLCHPRGSKGDR
jgi:hypothetical protein